MGCDIHMYSETKSDEGIWGADSAKSFEEYDEDGSSSWMNMDEVTQGRNYGLFGLLVRGVRREWGYSFEERGLPDDLSMEVRSLHQQWDSDAHSASHLTVKELKEKAAELLLIGDEVATTLNGYLTELIGAIGSVTDNQDNHRIVFWFDN